MKMKNLRALILTASLLLLPVTFILLSPVILVAGAMEGIVTMSAIIFAILFILSPFFGRLWCGWICPFGSVQDHAVSIRDKPVLNPWINRFRYLLFIIWLVIIGYGFASAGGIRMIDPLYQTTGGLSVADPVTLIIYTVIIFLLLIVALVAGRRGVCHLLCPISCVMMVGRKIGTLLRIPALRLKAASADCIHCGRCTRECTQSLDVQTMVEDNRMENPECILCGVCVEACPKGVIRYTVSGPDRQ
jgi:polyferredoxin